MRNSQKGGPGNIRFYEVLSRLHETNPVYTIEPEKGEGRKRTVHRNPLFPCIVLTPDDPTLSRRDMSARKRKQTDSRNTTAD